MVVVGVNHRLNALGYTYLGDISPEFADSGNAGMLDIGGWNSSNGALPVQINATGPQAVAVDATAHIYVVGQGNNTAMSAVIERPNRDRAACQMACVESVASVSERERMRVRNSDDRTFNSTVRACTPT